MLLSSLCLTTGVLCGIYYSYLGIVVGDHLQDLDRRKSVSERVLLIGLAWSVGSGDEYSDAGKQICKRGNWVLVIGILSWFAWGVTK
jgi:predicted branched-subunit amino acid permease